MKIAAVVCFVLSVLAEGYGGTVVARTAFGARALRAAGSGMLFGVATKTAFNEDVVVIQPDERVTFLVEQQAVPLHALVLLAVGIAAGFVGNILSL